MKFHFTQWHLVRHLKADRMLDIWWWVLQNIVLSGALLEVAPAADSHKVASGEPDPRVSPVQAFTTMSASTRSLQV